MESETHQLELLRGLVINDKNAIETIYKENFNMVQSLITSNNGTSEDARDVFQEAMIVLFEKVRTGSFELNCQIKTFLYSVSRRIWLKKLIHQSRFHVTDSEVQLVHVEEELEEHEKRNTDFLMMEKAMNGLGEPCKSLLEAFYLEKKSMVEIANNFGYTNADNAKTQKYKCLMRLKKLFFTQYKSGAV